VLKYIYQNDGVQVAVS